MPCSTAVAAPGPPSNDPEHATGYARLAAAASETGVDRPRPVVIEEAWAGRVRVRVARRLLQADLLPEGFGGRSEAASKLRAEARAFDSSRIPVSTQSV